MDAAAVTAEISVLKARLCLLETSLTRPVLPESEELACLRAEVAKLASLVAAGRNA